MLGGSVQFRNSAHITMHESGPCHLCCVCARHTKALQ